MSTDSGQGWSSDQARTAANEHIINHLKTILDNGSVEVTKLRRKLELTYYLLVFLSTVMFVGGIALWMVPVVVGSQGFNNATNTDLGISGIAGGLGAVDLTALFLLKPVRRIKKLMGDMSQLTVAINSYQTQMSLRLLESDAHQPETLGSAAEHVKQASHDTIELIERYFGEELSK